MLVDAEVWHVRSGPAAAGETEGKFTHQLIRRPASASTASLFRLAITAGLPRFSRHERGAVPRTTVLLAAASPPLDVKNSLPKVAEAQAMNCVSAAAPRLLEELDEDELEEETLLLEDELIEEELLDEELTEDELLEDELTEEELLEEMDDELLEEIEEEDDELSDDEEDEELSSAGGWRAISTDAQGSVDAWVSTKSPVAPLVACAK